MSYLFVCNHSRPRQWGFTLRIIGSQSVSEPFMRERGVGQGCPLVPLLFALAIEPLSCMLKLAMSGMHIDRIHVKQDTRRAVVAMCADDITIFAGGLEDIAHAKGGHSVSHGCIISIHQLGQDHDVSVWQHAGECTTTRHHSWHDSGTKGQDSLSGFHHLS